jgi:DNA-binding SARP family transcriptional activator
VRVLSGLVRLIGQLLARLVKAGLLVAIVAGIPYGLYTQIGRPLPDRLPRSLDQVSQALTAPVSDTLVLHVLALALWVLWGAFLVCLLVEVAAAVRGVPAPRLRLVAPLQTVAGWLVAGVTASVLIATPVVSVAGHASPAVATAQPATATAEPAAATTVPVAAHRATQSQLPVYEVARGDWMVAVAERFLGDEARYVDIERLNPQWERHDGRFPDHWEPGWRVVLPVDTRDRGPLPHASGQLLVVPAVPAPPAQPPPGGLPAEPEPTPSATPSATPAATPSASSTPVPSATGSTPADPDPDGVVPEPSTPPSSSTAAPSAGATGSPTGLTSPSDEAPEPAPDADDGQGVELPGGWVGLPLAAALIAAAAMVWRRRRHRYVPRPVRDEPLDDPDLRPLPPVVNRLRHAVRQQAPDLLDPPPGPRQPTVTEYAEADTDELELPPIGPSGVDLAGLTHQVPAGGLGLTGAGAEPAARALVVATLSTGSPTDPDARGQVVIPADALTTLLGAHSVEIGPIPRLSVTPTLSDALMLVEELLIERRRQLQEHDAADLAELRATDPYHPPMPPVLLLAEVPPPELRARLSTTLHLGTPLQISAVLLGEWPRGDTLSAHADGRTTGDGQRLAVLDVPTTVQLLHVLREAHTGQPTPPAQPEPSPDSHTDPSVVDRPVPDQPAPPADTPADPTTTEPAAADLAVTDPTVAQTPPGTADAGTDAPAADPVKQPAPAAVPAAEHTTADPAGTEPAPPPRPHRRRPVRIHLLGEPAISDRDGTTVTGLRSHARQLLVYLAVHRDGADLDDIMEAFWPTATVRRAGERLSTEVANLRGRIRQAAGDDKTEPVINTGGRYVLNNDVVDIDLWRMSDALRRAGAANDPAARIAALREAVDVHTGGLADGHDYDWIEQPREQIRRHGVRARLHLANLLADHDPTQAATLAQAAADLDPYNEAAARHAMKTLARIGDAAGIRTRLQRLREALDEIDEEPSGETIALAAQLQRQMSGTNGPRTREQGPDDRPPPGDEPPRSSQ